MNNEAKISILGTACVMYTCKTVLADVTDDAIAKLYVTKSFVTSREMFKIFRHLELLLYMP